jgi:hypothetical protein
MDKTSPIDSTISKLGLWSIESFTDKFKLLFFGRLCRSNSSTTHKKLFQPLNLYTGYYTKIQHSDGDRNKKNRSIGWNSLVDASNLSYFDWNAETQVIADASPVGLGAVLVQKQNNEYKVICYASRSLTAIERKYYQTEMEALGLVWACERFHMYLIGHDFELLTDHRPLVYIFTEIETVC